MWRPYTVSDFIWQLTFRTLSRSLRALAAPYILCPSSAISCSFRFFAVIPPSFHNALNRLGSRLSAQGTFFQLTLTFSAWLSPIDMPKALLAVIRTLCCFYSTCCDCAWFLNAEASICPNTVWLEISVAFIVPQNFLKDLKVKIVAQIVTIEFQSRSVVLFWCFLNFDFSHTFRVRSSEWWRHQLR